MGSAGPAPAPAEPPKRDDSIIINELCLEYWRYATADYEPRAAGHHRGLLKLTRHFFGSRSAASFGPTCLRTVRERWSRATPPPIRPASPGRAPYVNGQVHRL